MLTAISTTKQACANTTCEMNHAEVVHAVLLMECVSFAEGSLLEAHHRKRVLRFEGLTPLALILFKVVNA